MNTRISLFFDWNGTLVNDGPNNYQALCRVMDEFGIQQVSYQEYQLHFGFPLEDYYRKLGFDFSRVPFSRITERFMLYYHEFKNDLALHAGVESFFRQYSDYADCYIISAYRHDRLNEQVKAMGLHSYFKRVEGISDDFAKGKTEILLNVVAEEKVSVKNSLFIGDTDHDAEVAKAAGMPCILIPQGHQHRSRLVDLGVNLMNSFEDFTRLMSLKIGVL